MSQMRIGDKVFEKNIAFEKIQEAVVQMAAAISKDYEGKEPLFLCVLNGSFMFAADLLKHFNGPCQISFIKLSSYAGTQTTGEVKSVIGLGEDIRGRHVVILEDIIDSGLTIEHLVKDLNGQGPESIRVATLLLKPEALQKDVRPDYVGMEIPNDFIVGYGLDYDGLGRNLPDIYKIVENQD